MTTGRALRQLAYTLLLVFFLKDCTSVLDAQEQSQPDPTIRVESSPKAQLVPTGRSGSVWIRVTIPRNAQNRAVCIILEGPLSRVSCYEHIGSEAPFRQEFGYRDLPAGEYLVVGELQWVDGAKGERKTVLARDSFRILSGE